MRKSRASLGCLSLMEGEVEPKLPKSLVSVSGVREGVDISELQLVGTERWHEIGRETFEGQIWATEGFAWEKNGESGGDLSGEGYRASLGSTDARLPVTQSDDPLSGGHLALGTSKAPLVV
jgi:hypothetical protein